MSDDETDENVNSEVIGEVAANDEWLAAGEDTLPADDDWLAVVVSVSAYTVKLKGFKFVGSCF